MSEKWCWLSSTGSRIFASACKVQFEHYVYDEFCAMNGRVAFQIHFLHSNQLLYNDATCWLLFSIFGVHFFFAVVPSVLVQKSWLSVTQPVSCKHIVSWIFHYKYKCMQSRCMIWSVASIWGHSKHSQGKKKYNGSQSTQNHMGWQSATEDGISDLSHTCVKINHWFFYLRLLLLKSLFTQRIAIHDDFHARVIHFDFECGGLRSEEH